MTPYCYLFIFCDVSFGRWSRIRAIAVCKHLRVCAHARTIGWQSNFRSTYALRGDKVWWYIWILFPSNLIDLEPDHSIWALLRYIFYPRVPPIGRDMRKSWKFAWVKWRLFCLILIPFRPVGGYVIQGSCPRSSIPAYIITSFEHQDHSWEKRYRPRNHWMPIIISFRAMFMRCSSMKYPQLVLFFSLRD